MLPRFAHTSRSSAAMPLSRAVRSAAMAPGQSSSASRSVASSSSLRHRTRGGVVRLDDRSRASLAAARCRCRRRGCAAPRRSAAISSAWTGLSRGDVAGGRDEDAVRVDRRADGDLDASAEPVDGGTQRPFVGDRAGELEQRDSALGPAGCVGVEGGGEQPLRAQGVARAEVGGAFVGRTRLPRARRGLGAGSDGRELFGDALVGPVGGRGLMPRLPVPVSGRGQARPRARRGRHGVRRRWLPGRSPSGPAGDAPARGRRR